MEDCVIRQILDIPFSQWKYEDKMEIVRNGRPTPELPDLICEQKQKNKNSYNRRFNKSNYDKYKWLCGSVKLNKLYCWPCLLFSCEKSPYSSTGFDGLSYLVTALDKHQKSVNHIKAYTTLHAFQSQQINHTLHLQIKMQDDLHNEKVTENRNVLKRIIDSVIFLGKQGSPFQNHDENETFFNKGNYIELLEFLANYDHVLSHHLKTASIWKGTSPTIQNDIIDSIASIITKQIKSEVRKTTFLGIILDETTDVINKSQLSTVVRYVDEEGICRERFLYFTDDCSDRTAQSLFQHVSRTIDDLKCSNKLVSYTFDGASVMFGHVSEFHTLIKSKYLAATFIPYYDHQYNLILSQSVNHIKEARNFFISLNGLTTFFSDSTSHTVALREFTLKRLPGVDPTRWSFSSELVKTVCHNRNHLINFFTSIEDEPGDWSSEEVIIASGFVRFLSKVQTIFFLLLFNKIFAFSDNMSIIFHKKSDISYCTTKVNRFIDDLQHMKNTAFASIWSTATHDRSDESIWSTATCNRGEEEVEVKKEEVQEDEEEKPNEKRRKYDENMHKIYERIFCEILDSLMIQTKLRFESQNSLGFVNLLDSNKFEQYEVRFPDQFLFDIIDPHRLYFDISRLKNELKVFYTLDEFRNKSIQEIAIHLKLSGLDVIYAEVYQLAELILTLPITTTSNERMFSALGRIKTYLDATQGQIRLNNLALLFIEKEILMTLRKRKEEIFFDEVINNFTSKEQRLELTYR